MITREQIELINSPFPAEATNIYKTVQDKRDGSIKVFTGRAAPYIIERLNEVFNYNWSFEVKDYKSIEKWGVIATVKITVYDAEHNEGITKEQAGGCQFIVDGVNINYGDTVSGAITAALGKTASLFGIGLDAYKGKLEATEGAFLKYKDFAIKDIEKFKASFWEKANQRSIVNEHELTVYIDVALEVGILDPSVWDKFPRKSSKDLTLDTKLFTDANWQSAMMILDKYDTVYDESKKKKQ